MILCLSTSIPTEVRFTSVPVALFEDYRQWRGALTVLEQEIARLSRVDAAKDPHALNGGYETDNAFLGIRILRRVEFFFVHGLFSGSQSSQGRAFHCHYHFGNILELALAAFDRLET
jgi:hypothetical protein